MNYNQFMIEAERSFEHRQKPEPNEKIRLGLDLGTASVVLMALGDDNRPLAAARRFSQVVKDGLVVDFAQARVIVQELKDDLENFFERELTEAAIAVPPGTSIKDTGAHAYVAEGAGLNIVNILDEPSAANLVLNIQNGAIVDIGGGTTGIAVIENSKVVHTTDEATGGTHLTLVIAGHHRISFEEAEKMKLDSANNKKLLPLIAPVLQKIGSIIKNALNDYHVEEVHLVGGTASTWGIEKIISKETGYSVKVGLCPILATPLGIAMSVNK